MVYANWKAELVAFEEDCDRIRNARRESMPTKVLGLAPLFTLPLLGSVGIGRRLVALAGMAVSGVSLLMEMDKQREAYGGSLAIDLNVNSDFDNLAGAFRTRSPRWEALALLYSQLDPIHIKDRLGHLSDDEAAKALNRMIRRVQKGVGEVREINPNTSGYADIVLEIASEWREDVTRILDRALFKAGVIEVDDLEDGEDVEAIATPAQNAVEPTGNNGSTVAASTPAASVLPLFDWAEFHRQPDKFPHLLLLGKTGGGKSTLAEGLLKLLGGDQLVITPHHRPQDFRGVDVVGKGRNYEAIGEALTALVDEMDSRYQLYSIGSEKYRPLNVVIDEYPAIAANCENAAACMKVLVREARKVKIRLLILSQGAEVKALGVQGEGSIRECFTYIRLRGFVEDHARRLKDEAIAGFIAQQPYPCMVEDVAADSSVLAALMDSVESIGNNGSTATAAQDNDEQSTPEPLQLPPAVLYSDTPALSDDAARLLGWMQRKGNEYPNGFPLRIIQQGKPLGKAINHTQEVLQPALSELMGANLLGVDRGTSHVVLNR